MTDEREKGIARLGAPKATLAGELRRVEEGGRGPEKTE